MADVVLAVDASNIREGGGLVHLRNVLATRDPVEFGFTRTVVWAGTESANLLRGEVAPSVELRSPKALDAPNAIRVAWQLSRFPRLAEQEDASVLFLPGGLGAPGRRVPVVTLFQNMLAFDKQERTRFGWGVRRLRLECLAVLQRATFEAADHVICLTEYSEARVSEEVPATRGRTSVIPHGIEPRFFDVARPPPPENGPVRVLYISTINFYKHQSEVAEAISMLRERGRDVRLNLIGPAFPPALRKLRNRLDGTGGHSEAICYSGQMPHEEIHQAYAEADLFVFASTCENLPLILLEAMASALPVVCSDYPPMPEVLGECGVYCDPENPRSIADAIGSLLDDPRRASRLARRARDRARFYSWERCAQDTLHVLSALAKPGLCS